MNDEKSILKEGNKYASQLVHCNYKKDDCQSYYMLADFYIKTNRALLGLKTFYKISGDGMYSHKYRMKLL